MAEFSNPNQQGGQDNKSLIAMMVVFVAVLVGAQYYHQKMNPQSASPSTPPATTAPAAAPSAMPPSPTAPLAAGVANASAPAAPVVQATAESTTVIENELYRITFSNRGAQVISWILKGPYTDADGKPLDLVHSQAAAVFGYPLSLYTYDGTNLSIGSVSRNGNHLVTLTTPGTLPTGLNGRAVAITGVSDNSYNGTYVVTQTGPNSLTYAQGYGDAGISAGGSLSTVNGATGEWLSQAMFVPSVTGALTAPATLTFKYSNGDLQATKTFSFDGTYVLHAEVQVTRGGVPTQALLSWPGGFGDQNEDPKGMAYANGQFDSDRNGSDEHLAPKKISGGQTLTGPFDWAGVSDPFFAAVFLPDSPATAMVATLHGDLDVSKTIVRVGFRFWLAVKPTKPLPYPILGCCAGR